MTLTLRRYRYQNLRSSGKFVLVSSPSPSPIISLTISSSPLLTPSFTLPNQLPTPWISSDRASLFWYSFPLFRYFVLPVSAVGLYFFHFQVVVSVSEVGIVGFRLRTVHRSELRPSGGQPSAARPDREAPAVYVHRKNQALRRRFGDNQGPGQHRYRNCHRRFRRRHTSPRSRPQLRHSVGQLKCPPLLPC